MGVKWIFIITLLFPMIIFQNLIHELSRGLIMRFIYKWKFIPHIFPSKRLQKFTWSHITYTPTKLSKNPNKYKKAIIIIMPRVINIIIILLSSFLMLKTTGHVSLFFALFAFINWIYFGSGLIYIFGNDNNSEIWKFTKLINLKLLYIKLFIILYYIVIGIPLTLNLLVILKRLKC